MDSVYLKRLKAGYKISQTNYFSLQHTHFQKIIRLELLKVYRERSTTFARKISVQVWVQLHTIYTMLSKLLKLAVPQYMVGTHLERD